MSIILAAYDISKTYGSGTGQVHALRGVSLEVTKGEMVAIMGPSGCGKSTLLTILGAVEVPSTGRVTLDGSDFSQLNDDERTLIRRRELGFIFQSFNLLPMLTSIENVALPLKLDGVSNRSALDRANAALGLVGMDHRKGHLPSMLSGGEQQRVAIARALVIEPSLLLADEPTGNLDSVAGKLVSSLIRGLVDDTDQTVVMVTHDPKVADLADRTIHLRDGRIDEGDEPCNSSGQVSLAIQER